MPKPAKDKSAHLQELEAVFERHTRRFSPFDVLGLRAREEPPDVSQPHEIEAEIPPTHIGVDTTHPHDTPTHMSEGGTPLPGEWIHTRVVVKDLDPTTKIPIHIGVDATHPHARATEPPPAVSSDVPLHNVVVATQLKAQLGKKARQVLGYLNSIRSMEHPGYTVPVGYAQISTTTDTHPHYLRRNVLPKLAMMGLLGIVHKSFQGTVYHLHYDAAFIHMVASEDETSLAPAVFGSSPEDRQGLPGLSAPVESLPLWIDRASWGWLTPELVQQLIRKAGSERQAQEKLEMIVYNETHGPVD